MRTENHRSFTQNSGQKSSVGGRFDCAGVLTF